MWWKHALVVVTGAVAIVAVGCASGGGTTAPAPETRTMEGAELGSRAQPVVWIQVNADCTVDKEEAHVSESKGEEAHWTLAGNPGPLGIQFKLARGQGAFNVAATSATETAATVKAKEYGSHPYKITIGDKECPDPVLIIDP
jgi:hypothetical protein